MVGLEVGGEGRDMMGQKTSSRAEERQGTELGFSGCCCVTLEPCSGEGCSYMNIPGMSASDPWPNQSVSLLPKLPENSIPDCSKAEETAEKFRHRFQMRIWRSKISCAKIPSLCPEPHHILTSLEIITG